MNLTGTVSRRALSGTAASRKAVSGTIGRAQGGGGGSGTEIVDILPPDAEADVTESENVSIVSRQQAPPVTFTGSGSSLNDWEIYGSDDGVGDYTGEAIVFTSSDLELGGLSDYDGTEYLNTSRLRPSSFTPLPAGAGAYRFTAVKSSTAQNQTLRICVYCYQNDGTYIGVYFREWHYFPFIVVLPACKFRFSLSYGNEGGMNTTDIDSITVEPYGPNAPTIIDGYQIPVTTRLRNLLENNISNFSYRGIDFKINADKTITASGESTGTINVWFPNGSTSTPEYQQLEQKKYIISGSPSGTSNIFVAFRYKATESGSYTRVTVPSGQSVTIDNTSGNYNYVAVYIGMTSGKTIENAVLDPYLREYDDDFSYDKTFLVDKPLGAGESISKTSTGQNIQTVDGKETDFIIRTKYKPDLVWLIP